MPRLQVLNGKRQGEVYELAPNTEMVVGHRQSASISIDDPWVSWDHARLLFQPDTAACWIEDLGSTNGTYVNCVRVKREQLKHEDIIFLGKTHVIFLSPLEEASLFGTPQGGGTGKHTAVGTPAMDIPLPPPSSVSDPFPSSASGPAFASESGFPALPGLEPAKDDPFASTGSQNSNQAPLWEPGGGPAPDPFSESSVDPFSSGPDYSGTGSNADPAKRANPFAETRGDEQLSPLAAPQNAGRSLSLSGLGELDEVALPRPSSQEISNLIKGGGSNLSSDVFGEDLPPAAQPRTTSTMRLPAAPNAFSPQDHPFASKKPSEMRTQPISTDAVNELLMQDQRPLVPAPSPPPVAPLFNAEPTRQATRIDPTAPAPPGPPGPPQPPAPPEAAGQLSKLAYDKARLEDEVRRLRIGLQAAQQQNPAAVQAAANALRDQEMARLSQRVAELERDLAGARAELQAREGELNAVTEEMIEKEDLIDSLRDQLGQGEAPAKPQQDWSSLEF